MFVTGLGGPVPRFLPIGGMAEFVRYSAMYSANALAESSNFGFDFNPPLFLDSKLISPGEILLFDKGQVQSRGGLGDWASSPDHALGMDLLNLLAVGRGLANDTDSHKQAPPHQIAHEDPPFL